MQLTTENTKEFIEFWNNNKPEKFVHPMYEGIANVILDYLDQAEYQLTLEDNKVTIFDQQTNEELGEYTPEELFWKARLLIESNDKGSRSSTNHYNNLLDIFSNKELSPKEYKEQIRDELQNYYLTNECFNKNDELKWNSIDYTTKNWIEIENTYYEYEETRGFLSIGDSLTDLEEEYGENNFPEKAVEDGKLKIFDVYANEVEGYLREKYRLKDSEEINELLWDYEYQTKDVLKYYILKIDNEQLEVLSDIVDSQNINLESLRNISFEDIYNKIDKSKLNEIQLEELNKIKEELSKPTVEIFKQSFDSFIMSLSEAASKSIQKDIENIKAKALYVFNVDNNEYTIVSKRNSENPFMIHKYYPENETGGLHHGSYDIDTYENAEKIAANRLINEQKEKYELINFIAGTREEEFNLELKNELTSVFEYLNEYSLNEEDQIELIDVKAYQYEGPSGKLKVLVEYKGNCREDDLFNLLHDDEENGQDGHDYEINGYKIDLNPIKAEKSGTISEYLAMLKNVEEKWPEVNKQEWQKSIEAWNKNKQGTNSEFKSIGTLIEVDSSDEQQIESLRKNTKEFNIDQKEAKALLSMVNYDSSSFEFMFDIDNGNFVEIDKKNKKIIDVATSKNILGYLSDEIKYRIKEDVSESFTVEELFNANVLNNVLEYINKEPRYFQELNKVEKEAVISGYWEAPDPEMYEKVVEEFYYKKGLKEPEPGLVQYPGDEWVSNYLSENKINFNTEYWNSIFEVVNRQENAFEVAKKYLTEIDDSKEYDEFQKLDFVKKFFNLLKQGWDEYDEYEQPPSYKELEILIKGKDAFEYGEDSLSFIRPDADAIENGFDNSWDFEEICKGYAEFADGYNESNVICRLDDMMIFDSDSDAAIQAKKDGYQFLEVGKDIIFPEEMLNDDIEYRNYIDTPENRKILNEYLRDDLKKNQMYKIIYKQSSQGIEEWHEYDPNGNEIHYKDSNGAEEWIEYDSNGNRIHYKNNGGYEEWYEYNSNGKEIHYKDSEGEERWYEYDSNGNKICSKDSDNLETHHEYDSNGNEIYSKNSSGYEQWYEYDSNGNKIHYKDSNGFEQWYEYNSNGNLIHYKDSHSFEYWKEYDSKGNVIHYKEATGFERWLKYDSNGNHIYSKDSNGSEKWSPVEYLTKEQYLLEKNEVVQKLNKADSLTFGQFNSETNELKLIKEAYFKELVIDENDASKNKVVLGFKENDQEQLLEMGEVEYKNLLKAFGFLKEQQENSLEINKYKTFAEEKPEVVFDMIKSDYLGGTPFSDNELIGYLKGLKKSNNYHHYLDELLFESLERSDESLFSNVVDAGADLTWRREENGEPINILHYAAADNLDIAIKKIIEKTKSLEVDDYINLFSEENFEGHTPLEIAISNSGGEYFESTKLLIDAMDDKGFSGVKDLLFEDKLGNKVLYTSKDNLDCVSILCFDENNNLTDADSESLNGNKTLGEVITRDLTFSILYNFLSDSFELNCSPKLISKLKEVPQKLWDDEINIKLLKTLPEAGFFNSKKDLYDFDSILALEKIKKSLFSDFDNQKESLLQGLYTKKEFVDSIKEKELNLEELNNCEIGEFVECLENKYFRTELAALCFDKKINELFDTISPRPNEMGMYKNNDYTCLSLKINAASNNRPITEGEAEIILKYIQYENFNFYESMNNELCMLDVSEDFTGEGEIMTPEKIVDMAHRMMVKARDEEYSIYDVTDEKVINDLQERFGSSKDEELKKQETSVVKQFFTKLKDSICDNAKLEDVLKSAASVLQTFSDTEKKEISQYLRNKDASLGNSGNGLSSILEITEPGQKKKRSKADDDTRGR